MTAPRRAARPAPSLLRPDKRYVYADGSHLMLVIAHPRLDLRHVARETARSAGVLALLAPIGFLLAAGVLWMAWFGVDTAQHQLAPARGASVTSTGSTERTAP